jgi:acetolactate synthase-1/2/3 large subunit
MNIHELATVAQEDLRNFHLCILNNGGYASIRNSQMNHFDYKFGCDADSGLILPNYSSLADMFGFEYLEIKDSIKLDADFFSTLFLKQKRTLINLKINPIEEVGPKLKTLLLNGKPTTQDFGALAW